MIWLLIGLLAAATSAGATITFWNTVRTKITEWLRERGLAKGALIKAVIVLDKIAVGVRRQIKVRTVEHGVEIVSEEHLTADQIDDPSIRKQLELRNHIDIDILHEL